MAKKQGGTATTTENGTETTAEFKPSMPAYESFLLIEQNIAQLGPERREQLNKAYNSWRDYAEVQGIRKPSDPRPKV